MAYKVGDLVKDTTRSQIGAVWAQECGVLDLQNQAGYTWRALARRCELVKSAPETAPRFPPNTRPEMVTPEGVKVGDYVRLEDGRPYRVGDMRASGPGGRVLHLDGRPRPWVMPTGPRQVYRPVT
ncbi:hypothetical protein J7E91_23000 [Streptomyces sp. ISL-99]|uniref:hypothetical protein n=1 Tax=Streptomyces sp. ISL-99 TaxID=2819193 RepID=UPI001BECC9F3|nr:hypothetical protein [Streptomyces sp. ISL-99]MBT2528203.1 hypothetical protein [Streptomyces sp. ISL-99]